MDTEYSVRLNPFPRRGKVFIAVALCYGALCYGLISATASSAPIDVDDPSACTRLSMLSSNQIIITQAAVIAANTAISSDNPQFAASGQPAHCMVRGEVNHHVGADGHTYGDRFELRLPVHWTDRILFIGGGGLDGTLRPAVGLVVRNPKSSIPSALSRGYAVVSTDAGHDQSTLAAPGDFGVDPKALADYEFDSTRVVLKAALIITQAFYQRPPEHSYFMGCSTGGREALIAAQRYPELFDGIIAGSPANHLTRAMVAEAWNSAAFASIAPKDSDGRPMLYKALTPVDLHLLSGAVLKKCDALDGARDGIISDPLACHFDPQVLACADGQEKECLSNAKIAVIKKVFAGPKNSGGQALFSDWIYDTGVGEPGWRQWMLGTETAPPLNMVITPEAINGMALARRPPAVDILHFDFDNDTQRVDQVAAQLDAVSTDYSQFKKSGGRRLLMYVGVSDPVFSASDLIRYYRAMSDANGGMDRTRDFARLFVVPGMTHCAGGNSTDDFDSLGAIESWVEQGKKPERIIASGAAFPGRTRPLCPFPAVARYAGSKDMESAENFVCK